MNTDSRSFPHDLAQHADRLTAEDGGRSMDPDFQTSWDINDQFFELLHGISSALDDHSIRCFANRETYFSITEV